MASIICGGKFIRRDVFKVQSSTWLNVEDPSSQILSFLSEILTAEIVETDISGASSENVFVKVITTMMYVPWATVRVGAAHGNV